MIAQCIWVEVKYALVENLISMFNIYSNNSATIVASKNWNDVDNVQNSIKENIFNSIPHGFDLVCVMERARIRLIDIIELFSPECHFILFFIFRMRMKSVCIAKAFQFYNLLRIGFDYWLLLLCAICKFKYLTHAFCAACNHDRSFAYNNDIRFTYLCLLFIGNHCTAHVSMTIIILYLYWRRVIWNWIKSDTHKALIFSSPFFSAFHGSCDSNQKKCVGRSDMRCTLWEPKLV